MKTQIPTPKRPWWRSPISLVLLGCLVIVGVFLIADPVGVVPYALLLVCPLLHLVLHGSHGSHGGGDHS